MKQVWKIGPEFKRLSVPLSPEEENRLENSLLREGCKESIAVWHGCILDGHKRYEICSYEEIEYEAVEMDFATKDFQLGCCGLAKNILQRQSPIPLRFGISLERDTF